MSGSGGVSSVTLRPPGSTAGGVLFEVNNLYCCEEIESFNFILFARNLSQFGFPQTE